MEDLSKLRRKVRSADATRLPERSKNQRAKMCGARWVFLEIESSAGSGARWRKKGSSNRREQNDDGSGRGYCREPDIKTACARMTKSSNWVSPEGSGAELSSSSKHTSMAVVDATSESTFREDVNEKWSKYARTGTATYTTVYMRETEIRGEGKLIVGSAEQFHESLVKGMVRSARENAEARESLQEVRKTGLHSSC